MGSNPTVHILWSVTMMHDKYLEAEKFPEAEVTISDASLPKLFILGESEVKEQNFKGTLKLHGVEKEITGKFSIGKDRKVNSKFNLNIKDYAISVPEYLGIKVAESVQVQTELVLTK